MVKIMPRDVQHKQQISISLDRVVIDKLEEVRGNFSRSAVVEAMLMEVLDIPFEMVR